MSLIPTVIFWGGIFCYLSQFTNIDEGSERSWLVGGRGRVIRGSVLYTLNLRQLLDIPLQVSKTQLDI